jgi:hypothetical protein
MSIIEKLGIKLNNDGCHQFKSEEIYKSVKDAAPEMLEALIDIIESLEWLPTDVCIEDTLSTEYIKSIKAIEKATGKSWEEIKELL